MEKISNYILDNGLKVFLVQNKGLHTYAINLSLNYGIFNEKKGSSGVAHFIEHMVFEGTNKQNKQSLRDNLDNYTIYWNGETDGELTSYQFKSVDYENIDKLLLTIKDMVFNSNFPNESIVTERNAIFNEVVSNFASEFGLEGAIARAYLFKREPMDFLGGNPSKIERIKKDSLFSEYIANYLPNNSIISVVGKFDLGEAKKYINKNFGGLETRAQNVLYRNVNVNSVPSKNVYIENSHDYGKQSTIVFGIKLPGAEKLYKDSENSRASLGVLRTFLSNNLMNIMREKTGVAYSVDVDIDIGRYTGYIAIGTKVKDTDVSLSQRQIKNQLEKILDGEIDSSYVNSAKENSRIDLLESRDSTLDFANSFSSSVLKYSKTPFELYKESKNINLDDLRAAGEYFKNYERENSIVVVSNKKHI